MSGNGYYPPEYGIEVGERCGRDRCRGRMMASESTDLCDNCVYGEDADMCFCKSRDVVACGICGSEPGDD